METIWKRELGQHSHVLRLSTLETLEGVGKIVDTHVSQALGTLGDGERHTAIDLFDHLVTPSGGKIAESVPDLASRTGHHEDHVSSVLDKLDHARIVRPVPAPRRDRTPCGSAATRSSTTCSRRRSTAQSPRARPAADAGPSGCALSALAVALLVVAVVLAAAFFGLWRTSVKERQTALSSQLAAVANTELTVDPDMSALLARQALSLARHQPGRGGIAGGSSRNPGDQDVPERHGGFRSGVRSGSTEPGREPRPGRQRVDLERRDRAAP